MHKSRDEGCAYDAISTPLGEREKQVYTTQNTYVIRETETGSSRARLKGGKVKERHCPILMYPAFPPCTSFFGRCDESPGWEAKGGGVFAFVASRVARHAQPPLGQNYPHCNLAIDRIERTYGRRASSRVSRGGRAINIIATGHHLFFR